MIFEINGKNYAEALMAPDGWLVIGRIKELCGMMLQEVRYLPTVGQ